MGLSAQSECVLSVIVPVYNIEAYIRNCLLSLCMQGLLPQEYEIICVNDGSTDSSSDIIKEMAHCYPQIKVVDKQNGGVSVARNVGMDMAQGEYLFFCDGDDFVEPFFLKEVVTLCRQQGATSASFAFQTVNEDAKVQLTEEYKRQIAWTGGSNQPFYSGNVWRFIIRRDFILSNHIRFKTGMRYAEDELFLYHVCRFLDFSKHIYIDDVIYNYRNRPTSAVHEKQSVKLKIHYADMIEMALEYKRCLEQDELSGMMYKMTKSRLKYAVSNALLDAMLLADRRPRDVIAELKQKGLYPYGLHFEMLRFKKPKTMLVNYVKFLFPVSLYYIIVCKIRKITKRS